MVTPNLPSSLASLLNSSIATLMGPPRRNHAWGGSMAITRKKIEECRLLDHWDGALSDDYQLTRAVKSAGHKIIFVPPCLVVSPAGFTWSSFLEFARRQYTITRIHAPLLWLAALLITALYTTGWISALICLPLSFRGWGVEAWIAVALLNLLRARLRRRAVTDLLSQKVADDLAPVWTLERYATPLWMALHFAIILSTTFTRRITWAGITYHLRSRQDIRILSRP